MHSPPPAPQTAGLPEFTLDGASFDNLSGFFTAIRFTEKKLTTCHPANIPSVQADLAAARRAAGQTLFEIITSIIRAHGPGGAEAQDNVHLILA